MTNAASSEEFDVLSLFPFLPGSEVVEEGLEFRLFEAHGVEKEST